MIPGSEAKAQRNLTAAFIGADISEITLTPVEYVSNGSGGRKRTDSPARPPQSMRLIPQGVGTPERTTIDGVAAQPTMVLLGVWDAGMERGDRFVHNGIRYEVVFVHDKRDYQVKGEVITRGTA